MKIGARILRAKHSIKSLTVNPILLYSNTVNSISLRIRLFVGSRSATDLTLFADHSHCIHGHSKTLYKSLEAICGSHFQPFPCHSKGLSCIWRAIGLHPIHPDTMWDHLKLSTNFLKLLVAAIFSLAHVILKVFLASGRN